MKMGKPCVSLEKMMSKMAPEAVNSSRSSTPTSQSAPLIFGSTFSLKSGRSDPLKKE
jgi:hypothetical protein